MVGWSLSTVVTAKVADNPLWRRQLRATRAGQRDTYDRYIRANFVLPADVPANQCDRIHGWILWQSEQAYGSTFWPDVFRELRKESQALSDAVRLSDPDRIRNARYQLTVACLNRLPKVHFSDRLQAAGISTTVDVKSLHPESPNWNRRLTPP
jgi:hypothetical protein